MGPDAIAAMEARLLAVERRCMRLEDDARDLSRRLLLGQQHTWDAWGDFRRHPAAVVVAASGHPQTGICGGISLPDSIPFTDPAFGVSANMTWDGSSAWTYCASGLTSKSNATITFALHYKLTHSTSGGATLNLAASWKDNGTGAPVASSCSDATTQTDSPYTGSTQTCPPPTYSKQFVSNASVAIRTLYQSNTAIVTIGPVAPV